jgi:FkbM family methyltransferase
VKQHLCFSRIPVLVECAADMRGTVGAVLRGEYEAGYFGAGLTILDIGANVGSFSLWANMRWPGSVIHAYEPHPETFEMLARNLAGLPNVTCHRQAVFPTVEPELAFYSRHAGDGEAGLVASLDRKYQVMPADRTFAVPVLHPRSLPACDVLKVDVEGAEARILESLDLERVSLILLEYHHSDDRQAILRKVAGTFLAVHEESYPWDAELPGSPFRKDLAGSRYGDLFLVNQRFNKLKRLAPDELEPGLHPPAQALPFRQLLAALPGAAARAVRRRLRPRSERP